MPRRTDLKRVLVIGSGPIVIGQACEFDYSGTPGVQGAARRGARGHPRQQQPGDDHDRPGAGGSHLRRAADAGDRSRRSSQRERPDARAADRRRPDRAQPRGRRSHEPACSTKYNVELIGASDRRDQGRRGSAAVQATRCGRSASTCRESGVARSLDEALELVEDARASRRSSGPSFTLGGVGGGIAYNIEEFRELAERGLELSPVHEILDRGVGHRLEGVRARGDARRRRQLRRHLLDREHRPDGRAHRRQHHRRAGADADRQGIPADARRRAAHHPPGRRRDRRLATSSSRSTRRTAG